MLKTKQIKVIKTTISTIFYNINYTEIYTRKYKLLS
jgi:hypothetical protein